MTEIWFRNPHAYIREMVEVGGPFRVAWDRGILVKKRIDAKKHAEIYFGTDAEYDILCVGDQGTAHFDQNTSLDKPLGVYPTWAYGEDIQILEEMVSSPIGLDAEACSADVPRDERPVIGQEHRVVIINPPNAQAAINRPFYRMLRELQEEYPECNLMLHGSYSYRVIFGMGFTSGDVEPRTDAANGKVVLPNGKIIAYARTVGQLQWVNLLGTSVTDLKIPRNRCMFNIKSALWAADHYNEAVKFKSRGSSSVDPDSPKTILPTTSINRHSRFEVAEGDMISCDTCSLADGCKQYREGAVCSVKGSETSSLARMFQSRDSGQIIDGLGSILSAQTNRLERGMGSEEEFGELDPEVTKIMNQLFANGVKLAKLVDPSLSKPMVQINNGNLKAVAGSSPKELGAAVIRELESQGFKREDITPEMFERMLLEMTGGPQPEPQAIPGKVVNE